MKPTALIRNLATMTRNGTLVPLGANTRFVVGRLEDEAYVRRGKIHPFNVLLGGVTYAQGHGMRGGNTWTPIPAINAALEAAFYHAFACVEPSGKSTLIAMDVSGSMGAPVVTYEPDKKTGRVKEILTPITVRVAAACMAMVTVRTEPNAHVVAFSGAMVPVEISKQDSLEAVIQKFTRIPMGGTDCSLPMLYAIGYNRVNERNGYSRGAYVNTRGPVLDVDVFQIYTDNETWAGHMHPSQALDQYQRERNPNAKMAVVAMTASNSTIADPERKDMFEICGFDSAAPQMLADFAADRL